MKTGKVSQTILNRSVLRPLSRAGVLVKHGAAFGEDCGYVPEMEGMVCASVCGTVGGLQDPTLEMLIGSVMNNLITAGAETNYIAMDILFPDDWEEIELKKLAERAGIWCKAQGIAIVSGHTEVSNAVKRPVVSVTAWGKAGKNEYRMTSGLLPDQDLVMTGWIGMAGTVLLAKNREQELLHRYPFSIIDRAKELEQKLLVQEAAKASAPFGIFAMHDVSQGGVFAALWEMAECAGVGLDVDMKRIPVRQETIEICEFFDLNPYQLYGQGALLIGTARGEAMVEHLAALGIPAAVIGQTTSGNDRIIRNGEDVRYLDRPAQDALRVLDDRK